jgi:hypothetical protein
MLSDEDLAILQTRAHAGTLQMSDARQLLADALLERGGWTAAEL